MNCSIVLEQKTTGEWIWEDHHHVHLKTKWGAGETSDSQRDLHSSLFTWSLKTGRTKHNTTVTVARPPTALPTCQTLFWVLFTCRCNESSPHYWREVYCYPILQMRKLKQCLSNLANGKSYGSLVLFRDTQAVKIPSERWLRWGPRGL